jgi:hypothetical protein
MKDRIKTEADAAANGQQPVWLGGIASVGHALGTLGKATMDVASPIWDNPITHAVGDELTREKQQAVQQDPAVAKAAQLGDIARQSTGEAIQGFEKDHPLASARIGSAVDALNIIPEEAGLGALLNKGTSGLGDLAKGVANRMENTSIKIGAKDARMGAKIENFGKYGLFGSPEKVQDMAQAQIEDAASKLKSVIATSAADPANNVSVSGALGNARKSLLGGNMSELEKANMEKAFNRVSAEVEAPYLAPDGLPQDVDLVEAQRLKRYIGKKGDWLSSPGGGMLTTPNAAEDAVVHNAIYDALKKELESKGGAEVKELNTKMSELIPLERAAGRRVLVASRNNPIRFDDFLGGMGGCCCWGW